MQNSITKVAHQVMERHLAHAGLSRSQARLLIREADLPSRASEMFPPQASANASDANRILAEVQEAVLAMRKKQEGELEVLRNEVDSINLAAAGKQLGIGGVYRDGAIAGLGSFARDGMPQASMSIGSLPDGGHTVRPELDKIISRRLVDVSPLRSLAEVVTTTSSVYERVAATSVAGAEWATETSARNQTATPNLAKISIPAHELSALAPVTQQLLEDSEADIGDFLLSLIAEAFSKAEATAFVSGSGTGQPRGFLTAPRATTADGVRAWGTIQTVPSGHATQVTSDSLVALLYTLRAPFRRNAAWLMSSATAQAVMGLKDTTGRPLWLEGLAAGQPPMLLGRPVHLDEAMPSVAAGSAPIALADWKRSYVITDRLGTSLLRDPFTARPYVLFHVRKRVGGGLHDSEAIKLLLVGTSA